MSATGVLKSSPAAVVGLLVTSGVTAVLLAADRAPVSITAPIAAPGAWRTVLELGIVAAFAAWVAAVLLAWAGHVTVRIAAAGVAVIQLVPLAGPVMFSGDAGAYERYAQIAGDGGNPYTADVYPRLVYGPLFTGLVEIGDRLGAGVTTYRVVACLSWLAVTFIVYRLTRSAAALVLVGWSPQLAMDFAGAGHNDAVMVLLMVGSIALTGRRWGGVLWIAGAAVKWIPLVLLPHRLLLDRRPRSFLIGFGAALAVIAVAATARYGTGWLASTPIFNQVDSPTRNSLPHLVGTFMPQRLATLLVGLAFVVCYLWLVRRSYLDGRPRMAMTLAVLVISMPWLMGWYIAWGLPLAALERDRRAAFAWIGIAGFFLAWGLLS